MKIKKIIWILFLNIFSIIAVLGQGINHLTTSQGQGGSYTHGNSLDLDNQDNLYLAGHFSGNFIYGTSTLIGPGSISLEYDSYLLKTTSSGSLLWTRHLAGYGMQVANKVASDKATGDVFVSGYFSDSIRFNNVSLADPAPSSDPNPWSRPTQAFVARYNSLGNLQWAKQFGGAQSDKIISVNLLPNGDALLYGSFKDTAVIGSFTFPTSFPGQTQGILIRLDSAGNVQWATVVGYGTEGSSMALDYQGNIYLASFSELYKITGASAGAQVQLVYQLTSNQGWFNDIKTTSTGEVIAGGAFSGNLFVGNTTLTTGTSRAGFLLKLNTQHVPQWGVKISISSQYPVAVNSISLDQNDHIALAGLFSGTSDFGTTSGNATTLTANGITSPFIARYSSYGQLVWVVKGGGSGSDEATEIVRSASSGNLFATGILRFNGTFGTIAYSSNSPNMFLLNIADTTVITSTEATLKVQELQVYPNPAEEQLHIEAEGFEQDVEVALLNLLGQPVWESTHIRLPLSLQTGSLPSGTYLLRLKTGQGVRFEKIQIR